MRRNAYLSVVVLLAMVLVALPAPLAAQGPSRAVDHPHASWSQASPPGAPLPAAPVQAAWQYGPPSTFEYQRFDGAFVPGPDGEPWANKIYFPGGRISAPAELPDIWVFDPVTGIYADTQANMIEDVSNYNADLILDDGTGRGPAVYVVGGYDKDGGSGGGGLGLVQRYYPMTNQIEALPPADDWPGQVNGIPVAGMGSAVVNDVIYVFGGWESDTPPYFDSSTWAFDPNQPSGSRWTNLGITLNPGRTYIQTAVQGGKIYAMGGISGYVGGDLVPTDVVEVLDTTNPGAGWMPATPLPVPTAEGRGFGFDVDTLGPGAPWLGKLYIAGGGDWPDISREVMEYDIGAGTWDLSFPDLNDRRVNNAGTFVPLCTPDPNDGLPGMWVFGGRSENGCDPPYGATEFYPLSCTAECSLLLVDDDWDFTSLNGGGRPYYTSTLETLGLPYNLWDTVDMGTPSAGDMAAYDVVIWFTGYDHQTPISPTEEVELMAYLDNGGNLLMSSQEQEWAFPGSAIMSDYFWVDSVNEDVILTGTVGGPADPLFSGLGPYDMDRPDQWDVYWPTGADQGPYDDEVYVKAGGFEPMIYVDSSEPNSTRYMSDTFKTLYLGFPFEWIPDLGDRGEFMVTALRDWFGCTVPCIGLTGLPITGPDVVLPGENGVYSVTVEPPNATQPIDIVWSNGMTGTSAIYSWAEPGIYTVVVTGTNCYGAAVVTDTLEVTVLCVELSNATIAGPDVLAVGETGTYSVTLEPPDATGPIDIVWSNGMTGTSAIYSWADPGTYTLAVTGTNCYGAAVVTDTFDVTVSCIELSNATIAGPDALAPGETGAYSVTLEPPDATQPIDVLWSNGETGYTTVYSWTVPGDYTIVVTGTNCGGTGGVTGTLQVAVSEPMHYIYLPMVVRNR
jgi:PKD repeat protein